MNYATFKEQNRIVVENKNIKNLIALVKPLKSFFEFSKDFSILPMESPQEGEIGCVFFRDENNEEKNIFISFQVRSKAVEKIHETRNDFEKAFSEVWDALFSVQICDDPVKMFCGFIVESREGRTWHKISLKNYKD